MSSRQARGSLPDPDQVSEVLPISARIAWSYLASLGALVVAAGMIVLGNASVGTAACRIDAADAAADCRLGWAVLSGLVGIGVGWVLLGLLLRLGWRYPIAATGFAAVMISLDRLETWWWWLLAALIPLAAALLSHEWAQTRRARVAREVGLSVLVVVAVGALVWWLTK